MNSREREMNEFIPYVICIAISTGIFTVTGDYYWVIAGVAVGLIQMRLIFDKEDEEVQ